MNWVPSGAVWILGFAEEEGFTRDGAACGFGTADGRARRISRSSKSSSTSEISPSEGSLSDTSSMRACDIVCRMSA